MVSPAKRSGFNGDPRMDQANADEWGRWRGVPLSVVNVFTTRDRGWGPIFDRSWAITNYKPTSQTGVLLSIHQPFWPENTGGGYSRVLSGEHDSQYVKWGDTLKWARGLGYEIDTHLAWEPNGDWYEWKATNPKAFRDSYKRFVSIVRKVDEHATFCLTFNRGYSQSPPSHDPLELLDDELLAMLDAIGVDDYDHWSPVLTEEEFDRRAMGRYGLTWWWEFAKQNRKGFQVPEWGCSNKKNGGGDNPLYIRKMWEWFRDHDTDVEMYYNNSETDNVRSDLKNINPRAGQKYRELFGPSTPVPQRPPIVVTPPPVTPAPPALTLTEAERDYVLAIRRVMGRR